MLGLPKSTEFNKRIPKQKFYEHLEIPPAVKRNFVAQIRGIYWAHKLAPATMNVGAGQNVTEIEVFRIQLNGTELDGNILKQIDREIPYHILFVLEHEEQYKAVIGYKTPAGSGRAAFKVERYFQTEWLAESQLPLHLAGLTMDAVYENFVRQIAGKELPEENPGESLQQSVERDEKRAALQKEIAKLRAKIRKEKQLNRQMALNRQLKKLKKQLEAL